MLDGENAHDDADDVPCPALFATETMAELSARQGRLSDAAAIYRHLLRSAEAEPDEGGRLERWKARLAELEGGSRPAPAPAVVVPSAAPPPHSALPRTAIAPPPSAFVVATVRPRATLVIREPVRSGQVVYADARDLI